MRILLALLLFAAGSANAQKMLWAHAPWTGADTCLLTIGVTNSRHANAVPTQTVERSFPVTVNTARGLAQYGYRGCLDNPALWPAGFYFVSLRLRREHDGALSASISGRFGAAPAYLAPPTGLQ